MNISILTGGSGPEREVSLKSAKFLGDSINFAKKETFLYPEGFENFVEKKSEFNIVVPIIHGDDGEDGKLQKKLKEHNVPYLFSDSDVHKKCFNKEMTKEIVSNLGFNVPLSYKFDEIQDVNFPLIAKPRENGSSVGVHLIKNKEDLEQLGLLDGYLYEEYIEGREFTVGIVYFDGKDIILPIMEIKKNKKVFSYEDKYSEVAGEIEIFPDDISNELESSIEELAYTVHSELNLKHVSRTDCIVSGDKVYFLEVNSIPGLTEASFIPKMVEKAGLIFSDLIEFWCKDVLDK